VRRLARAIAAAVALTAALVRLPVEGASFALSDKERQDALRIGERSIVSETFGDEWRVGSGAGENVLVFTPFHRLALAARNAAFKNEPFKPGDQDKLLQEVKDKVMLWVQLKGPSADFARHLRPRLVVSDREISPTTVQNERTGARQDDGRFLARCVYWFPTRDITGTSRVELVIKDPDDRPVARFPIDLARMR
jgi:hypothetical protein